MPTATLRGLGYRPDTNDPRDLTFARFAAIPFEHSLEYAVLDILDQGRLGSCVANAIAQAIRIRHVIQGVRRPVLASRLWTYFLARAIDHTEAFDAGCRIRSAFHAISKMGFCDEVEMPYSDKNTGEDTDPFRRKPTQDQIRLGFDRVAPTKYQRIPSGPGAWFGAKAAINAGFPVIFGVDVGEAFVNGDFDPQDVILPPRPDTVVGGHAMVAVGFNERSIKVCNSWGKEFGDDGFCYFSQAYIAQASDLWTIEHAPVDGEK